jgi:signal transduction histidine kinase
VSAFLATMANERARAANPALAAGAKATRLHPLGAIAPYRDQPAVGPLREGVTHRRHAATVRRGTPHASMTHATPLPIGLQAGAWLGRMDAYDTFALVVGCGMLTIAAAQLLASLYVDRQALRLFALRYAVAGIGWFTAHPQAHLEAGQPLPWPPLLIALALLALTIHALDVYLGQSTRRRRWGLGLAAGAALLVLAAARTAWPGAPGPIYAVMVLAMAWCAWQAARAVQRERNVGHAWIAAAFASYPAFIVAAWLRVGGDFGQGDLSYVVALPTAIVGVTILIVSLIRAVKRTQDALAAREAARQALQDFNATLERRVVQRTAELRTMVAGLEAFNRQVSHDLRGPLAGAASLSRLAVERLQHGDVAGARAMLDTLAAQSDRMQALVDDLLTLSRVADGEPRLVPLPMQAVVDEALEQLRHMPATAEALQRVAVEVLPLPEVTADAGLARQVWVNLLANAVRFAASAGASPVVRVGCRSVDGTTCFYVADNGPGFPPARAGELFQDFVRIHGQGLSHNGIGLAIVRRIVERHGGRVGAESDGRSGATFWFTLAPAPAPAPPAAA